MEVENWQSIFHSPEEEALTKDERLCVEYGTAGETKDLNLDVVM